jgi:TPR repeat protein
MCYDGRGASQNLTEAVRWFRKAAEQGVAEAQFNLGVMCASGQGIQPNHVESYMWFTLAFKQGYAEAAANRAALARAMRPDQIAEAHRRAKAFKPASAAAAK